jgi:hypothetical protein
MQTTGHRSSEQLFESGVLACVAGYDHVPKVVQFLSHRQSDAHGVPPSLSSLSWLGLRHTKAIRTALLRRALSPQSSTALSIRQDGTKVPYTCELLAAIPIHKSKVQKSLIFWFSHLHSPLLSLFPVSNLQCSPPRSRACSPRLTNNEPLTQMVAAAYQPVFLPHPPRHSCFIKLSAVPALPGCAFLVLTEAFPIPPRPIYSLRATNFTRFPHREARNSSPLP